MKKIRKLHADEIEVKIKQVKESGCCLLLYKTARTDMDILDETFGAENWQSDYKVVNNNLYAGIGVKLDGEWVWKWDCGVESRADGDGNEKKGEASDAFKRAGFKWGIGRELYTSPFIWASCDQVPIKQYNGKYFLQNGFERFSVKKIEYAENGDISSLVIINSKGATVWTFNDKTPIRPAETSAKNDARELSTQAKRDIESAQTQADLVSVYNAYAMSEPIDKLKNACAMRKVELQSGMVG